MTDYKYSFKELKENMAKAVALSQPVSTKVSVEISNFLRNMQLDKAKRVLEGALAHVHAIPYKRFNKGVGHKPGIYSGPGRYPEKTCKTFLALLNLVEANARHKGLNTNSLFITHLMAKQGPQQYHSGRMRRRKMKRTHIEIVVEEQEKKPEKKEKVAEKKAKEKKPEAKKETKVAPKPKVQEEKKPEVKEQVMPKPEEKKATEEKKPEQKKAEEKPQVKEESKTAEAGEAEK